MKKIINIIFIVLSMVILVLPTFANINIDRTVADIKGRAGDIVYDYADILNAETETQVREIINNIRYDANKGFEMIVVTSRYLENTSASSCASIKSVLISIETLE